jgi:hypothetical protein
METERTSRVRRGRPDACWFAAAVSSLVEIADATMFRGEDDPCRNCFCCVVDDAFKDRTPVKADADGVDERSRPLTASSPERRNNRPVNCFVIVDMCDNKEQESMKRLRERRSRSNNNRFERIRTTDFQLELGWLNCEKEMLFCMAGRPFVIGWKLDEFNLLLRESTLEYPDTGLNFGHVVSLSVGTGKGISAFTTRKAALGNVGGLARPNSPP